MSITSIITSIVALIIGVLFMMVVILTSNNKALQSDLQEANAYSAKLERDLSIAQFTAGQIQAKELLYRRMRRVPSTTDLNISTGNHTLSL